LKKVHIASLLILLLMGCSQSGIHQNKSLEESIFTIVEDEMNKEIAIHSLTEFEWDQAFLFEPYTPQDQMEKQMGVEFEDPSNIKIREDIYLLVFLHDGEAIQYAEVDRQKYDFSIRGSEFLTPDKDVIEISRD
jgi:hypothetical protein